MRLLNSPALVSTLRLLGALALSGLVVACAEAPPPETSTPAVNTQPPAQSTAAPRETVNIAKCASPAQGRIFFRVGSATLAPTGGEVVDAIPTNMKPPLKKEEVKAELKRQAATGSGCPEKPIEAVLLMLNKDLGHPLLQGDVGLVRSPKGQITQQFAQLTRQLQNKPTKNCKSLSGDLIGCVGTETRGQVETPVMYVITTDRSETLNTGGPLAARCVIDGDKIRGCNIVDELSGNLTFDVTLNAGDYSSTGLSGAHAAAVSQIESLRR